MIPYPHPHNEEHHNRNINEWWAVETTNYLYDRLINLVLRIKWNRTVVKQMINENTFSSNKREIHQHRMESFISELNQIEKQLRTIGMRYNPKRLLIIKKSIKQIQQL
jgi:hypothetical protein